MLRRSPAPSLAVRNQESERLPGKDSPRISWFEFTKSDGELIRSENAEPETA
jgi:hypothetical protein